MNVAIVVAGGPKEEVVLDDFPFPYEEAFYVGADHGAIFLMDADIIPNAAVGDFDSLTKEEWLRLKENVSDIEDFQAEKDETDTQLAIVKALSTNPQLVYLTGVTGGRLDHYEANLHAVYRLQLQHPNIPIIMMNKNNCLQFLFSGEHTIERNEKYKYISFYPFGAPVENMTLRGVKYETTNVPLPIGQGMFTSNEITERFARVSFTKGNVLMIRSFDE